MKIFEIASAEIEREINNQVSRNRKKVKSGAWKKGDSEYDKAGRKYRKLCAARTLVAEHRKNGEWHYDRFRAFEFGFNLSEIIGELLIEKGMRNRLYPKWIEEKKFGLTIHVSKRRTDGLNAVIEICQEVNSLCTGEAKQGNLFINL